MEFGMRRVIVRCVKCGHKIVQTRSGWVHVSGMAAANAHVATPPRDPMTTEEMAAEIRG